MKLSLSILIAAVMTVLGVAAASASDGPQAGKAPKPPKTAKFKATLKGEQLYTWSYNTSPQAPCYGGENAAGSARMFYNSTKPAKVTAYEIKKGTPLWNSLYQRVMFTPSFTVAASVDMEGEHEAGPPPDPDECEDNGGGVVPKPDICGHGDAILDVELAYVNKDKLLVRGDASSWDPGFHELRNLYGSCPYWMGGPYSYEQAEGDLTPTAVPLKEKKLFDRKGPGKFVLNGASTDCYEDESLSVCGREDGPFRGKIVTTWKLTLKRVK